MGASGPLRLTSSHEELIPYHTIHDQGGVDRKDRDLSEEEGEPRERARHEKGMRRGTKRRKRDDVLLFRSDVFPTQERRWREGPRRKGTGRGGERRVKEEEGGVAAGSTSGRAREKASLCVCACV
eukprot:1401511-Pleurochrysis_carterae.AAC.3